MATMGGFEVTTGGADGAPLVSVVVPLYNCERYIEECVSSVIMQSFTDWELVIVNDGSTDGSLRVCERLVASHPDRRIRVISQPNGGQSAARRTGILNATGTLALPFDSDDYLMDADALRKIADAYRAYDFDICLYDAYREKWDSPCIGFYWPSGPISAADARETLCSVHTAQGKMDIGYIFKVVRTELFRRTVNPPHALFEDRMLAFQLFDMAERYCLINECLYFYRNTPGSIANQGITAERLDCLMYATNVTDDYAAKWGISDEARLYMGVFRRTTLFDYIREACEGPHPLQTLRMLRDHPVYDRLNEDDPFMGKARSLIFDQFARRHYHATRALVKARELL